MVKKAPHPSYARLLEVAKACHVEESDIPGELELTPYRVGMWRHRGVSKNGAIKAAEVFNTSASHIVSGTGPTSKTPNYHVASIAEALSLITDKRTRYQAWHEALNAIAKYAPVQDPLPADTQPAPVQSKKRLEQHQP